MYVRVRVRVHVHVWDLVALVEQSISWPAPISSQHPVISAGNVKSPDLRWELKSHWPLDQPLISSLCSCLGGRNWILSCRDCRDDSGTEPPNTSKHTIHSHDVLLATTAGTVEAPNFSQLLGICEPSRWPTSTNRTNRNAQLLSVFACSCCRRWVGFIKPSTFK